MPQLLGMVTPNFIGSSQTWPQNVCKEAPLSLVAAHGTTLAQRKRKLATAPCHGELCYHRALTTRLPREETRLCLRSRPLGLECGSRRGQSPCWPAPSSWWGLG